MRYDGYVAYCDILGYSATDSYEVVIDAFEKSGKANKVMQKAFAPQASYWACSEKTDSKVGSFS
jgi:hypothetical protein